MPLDQPDHMPEDEDELELMVARAYSQGIDSGKKTGRLEFIENLKAFYTKQFKFSKGMRRLADPDDPKTAAILAFWEKLNEKLEDGTL
jgi:hypothetical protein